jgi:coenzyme F420-reducing hydrogenase beta subunit
MNMITQKANDLIGRLVRRDWSRIGFDKIMGEYESAYLSHASDPDLRTISASGAAVSAMLIHALEAGAIDGALVARTIVEDRKVRARFYIASTREEILASRGSIYVELKFAAEALPLITEFDGTLAVVGLPCHIDVMRRRMRRDAGVRAKVKVLIALVCGHSSRPQLIDNYTAALERRRRAKLVDYHFRSGHWRGQSTARFEDGSTEKNPFSRFSVYQNLYFFSEKKCFQCIDHFGYNADVSVGDVWSMPLKNDPVKHSGLIIRNPCGRGFHDAVVGAGVLNSRTIDAAEIMEGQARTAPFHYNISARMGAARLCGLRLKDTVSEPVQWNHRLVAYMALFNWKWSASKRWSGLIFKVPRPVLRAYLVLFKGLESF